MYDLVYDTFSDAQRREIEDAFRKIGRFQIDRPSPAIKPGT